MPQLYTWAKFTFRVDATARFRVLNGTTLSILDPTVARVFRAVFTPLIL